MIDERTAAKGGERASDAEPSGRAGSHGIGTPQQWIFPKKPDRVISPLAPRHKQAQLAQERHRAAPTPLEELEGLANQLTKRRRKAAEKDLSDEC